MKAGEHGPDEFYCKFLVGKMKDAWQNEDNDWVLMREDRLGGPGGEFIFTLRPETNDLAAIAALRTYADVCEATYPGLARDIRKRLDDLGL